MKIENRYAIVIGINDYEDSPLDYCVNDAKSIAAILIEKCLFKEENVHLITSEKGDSKKDITGFFESHLESIKEKFIPDYDSIFFYFAGHGKYYFEKSTIKFHDTFFEIKSVFDRLSALNPKYQCYVIDACESGGKVLSRGDDTITLIDKLLARSHGVLLMYASTKDERAKENGDLKHGVFTYHFLTAIRDDRLYDEDGILTPNRIHDHIAKEVSKESAYRQTPVIENRTIGYYPFAFLNPEQLLSKEKPRLQVPSSENEDSDEELKLDKLYFPIVPIEIRTETMPVLNKILEEKLQEFIASNPFSEDYNVVVGDIEDLFEYRVIDDLEGSIVSTSISNKVISYDEVMRSERKKRQKRSYGGLITAFMQDDEPEYIINYDIDWESEHISAKAISLSSDLVTKVPAGIVIVIYQALYGLGLIYSYYHMDYGGYTNHIFKGPFSGIKAYKYHADTVNNVSNDIDEILNDFVQKLGNWNAKVVRDIDHFDKRSK